MGTVILGHGDFPERAVISLPSVVLVAKIVRKSLKHQMGLTEKKKKLTGKAWTLPEPASSLSRISDEERYNNNARHHRAVTEEAPKENREHRKDQASRHSRS